MLFHTQTHTRTHTRSLDVISDRRQLVNHFSTIKCLTSKTGLLRSLSTYYSAAGLDVFAFTPTTFIVKNCRMAQRGDGSAFTAFCQRFKEIGTGNFSGV